MMWNHVGAVISPLMPYYVTASEKREDPGSRIPAQQIGREAPTTSTCSALHASLNYAVPLQYSGVCSQTNVSFRGK